MFSRFPKLFSACALLVLWPTALLSDVVYLRNGRVIEGTITSQDKNYVTIRTRGRTRRIPKPRIL